MPATIASGASAAHDPSAYTRYSPIPGTHHCFGAGAVVVGRGDHSTGGTETRHGPAASAVQARVKGGLQFGRRGPRLFPADCRPPLWLRFNPFSSKSAPSPADSYLSPFFAPRALAFRLLVSRPWGLDFRSDFDSLVPGFPSVFESLLVWSGCLALLASVMDPLFSTRLSARIRIEARNDLRLRVGFESHAARANLRTRSMTEAA